MQLHSAERQIRFFLESTTDAFVALDRQWRITYANQRVAALNHLPLEQIVGKTHWQMWPWSVGSRVEQEYRRAVDEQSEAHFEILYEPLQLWLEIHAYPSPDGLAIFFRDITEQKQTQQWLGLLAQASEVFAASLDYRTTLQNVAQLVVTVMADWCLIDIVENEQIAFTNPIVAAADPELVQLLRDLRHLYPLSRDADYGAPRVFRTGEPILAEVIPESFYASFCVSEQQLDMLQRLDACSYIIVPLVAHGQTLGTLVLASGRTLSGRHYSDRDLKTAEELARRASISVDNARAHRAEQQARSQAETARAKLIDTLDSITDAFVALDPEWRVSYVNRLAAKFSAKTQQALIGKNVWEEWPGLVGTRFETECRRAVVEQVAVHLEEFDVPSNLWFEVHAYPSSDGLGIYFRDITERRRFERQIIASLQEKEVLLREIHHRVKNNLQVVTSLLRLQAHQTVDAASIEALQTCRRRVQSMASIHELLYQSGDLASVDFGEYVRLIGHQLIRSYRARPGKVRLKMEACSVRLDLAMAIPCGLIVNELISNSLKHAFARDKRNRIGVRLSQSEQTVTLLVEDNGSGLPADFDPAKLESLGLQLVNDLALQLGGSVVFSGAQGTSVRVTFPVHR
ncbi:PAS domain-containing protein [Gloeobacter violaceus]|uniref:PAS domain-containing protein n=1 Tax=Gloeobacter violaceus TaxID=33072 RepID=UPI0003109721|nr:PAS domain-containing protein [Gloeobacter violaceus]